jgi:translation initiation factor 5
MNKMINIGGDVDDKFYRYKMPEVILGAQGAGQIMTFTNIDAVSKALSRDTKLLTKYIGKTLGTKAEYKKDTMMTMIQKRDLTKDILQGVVYKFIKQYVLCGGCKNPETIYTETKKGVELSCMACNHTTITDK